MEQDQAEGGRMELKWSLPHGGQDPKYLSQNLLTLRVRIYQEPEIGSGSGI